MSDSKKLDINETLARLAEDEDMLRGVSPVEGALGRNSSDYHNMWSLFTQVVDRANAMNADPTAFVTSHGVNEKTLNAWTKMIATAKSILSDLNRMRNTDRLVAGLLEDHTRALTQAVCAELGVEVKAIIDAIDAGEDKNDVVIMLKALMYRRIPEIFLKSASTTLVTAKEEFGLLH